MTQLSTRDALLQFRDLLATDGMRAALRFLNGLTPHRFTALFRFEGGTLRNLHLIDRQNPAIERCPDQGIAESYCIYVRSSAERFTTEAALGDERVDGHPKQHTVQSYCGVPLMLDDGTLFGTLCHFDSRRSRSPTTR